MSVQPQVLREQLRKLFERKANGDLPERAFQHQVTSACIALSRAAVEERLGSEEEVLAEHHLVHSHFRLSQSLLDDPEQVAESFFATTRGLSRVQNVLRPGRPPSYDEADGTTYDDIAYDDIERVTVRKAVRWGEAAVGAVMVLTALLLRQVLAVTGPMLLLLGVAGILHALLLPTRWFDVVARPSVGPSLLQIHGVRRPGARSVVQRVQDAVKARGQDSAHRREADARIASRGEGPE
jgi:hypothetical protein